MLNKPSSPQPPGDTSDRRRWYHTLLDLVYPPHCVACGQPKSWLCAPCLERAPYYRPPVCARCGMPGAPASLCRACARYRGHLAGVRSVGPHAAPFRQSIHALKYEGMSVLASPLGALLADCYRMHAMPISMVMPVPLHPARVRRRGYNQALLLAREMARRVDLPLHEKALIRHRDTPSQVGLSRSERRQNVHDAFTCTTTDVAGGHILLVDDVLTTGATLEACAAALLGAGAATVWAITLARALYRRDDRSMDQGAGAEPARS